MIEKKQAGKEHVVHFHAMGGDLLTQRRGFEVALTALATWGTLVIVDEVIGDNVLMCTFKIEKTPRLTEGQQRNFDLLKKERFVDYVTDLRFVLRTLGNNEQKSFEGVHNKCSQTGFDRRALDNLVRLGLVKTETTTENFGDQQSQAIGSGFRIVNTYRLVYGDS
jgi:hypothetical protein